MKRTLSLLLVLCMMFSLVLPATTFAAQTPMIEESTIAGETMGQTTEPVQEPVMPADVEEGDGDGANTEESAVTDYATFLSNLKVLENYAAAYAATSGKDAGELLINFLRTGVDRYNDGNWVTLAGAEITAFVTYVEEQDAATGTNAMILRDVDEFTIPNGQGVDFGHMFGTMNISYVNSGSADLGGWAGDICDLMLYSHDYGAVPAGTVDEMAAYILEKCFGVDADDAFGMDDFYGDMDAFYLNAQMKAGTLLSVAMEGYFTDALTDSDRAAYFLNNRFSGLETSEDVRNAVYNAYANNVGIAVLEADRGLADLADLRTACCYAFADYLFSLAGDRLESGSEGGEEGGEEEGGEDDKEEDKGSIYSVFSSTTSTLAPGVSQTVNYAYTADNKQVVYHVATVDISRDDVAIYANYNNNDPSGGWAMSRVTAQMAAAAERHSNPADPDNYIENYTPVLGVNADFYNMSNGKPSGALVMEGVQYNGVGSENFFAILKDGTPVIGSKSEWNNYAGQVQEAVGGSIFLVKDGELAVTTSSTYYKDRGPRTAVGITEDGQVVFVVLDGRQEPYSAGASAEEIAQVMLEAGCEVAINLDGGGSTTYAAKAEGSDEVKVHNSPSDGYERSVSSSLMVVSTAVVSNEFEYAVISTEYDYVTAYTPLELTAIGVSASGNAADIPEGAQWQLADDSMGTIEDGVFMTEYIGEIGEVTDFEIQLVLDGEVLGSKTIHVVIPDAMKFTKENMNVIYGEPTELPLTASFKGNPVGINEDEFELQFSPAGAAEGHGFWITANEGTGIKAMTVTAVHYDDDSVTAKINLNLFSADEAMFDFDNATSGDRLLAWTREVSNTVTDDEIDYYIDQAGEEMDVSYTFALDMTQIEIPEQLEELTYMLPGADAGSTAWEFLLQLAERVSTMTEVRVAIRFAEELEVDVSDLTISNEYFTLRSAELDEETNTLTIVATWIDQTMAIDPATANPICILSGIKAVPRDDVQWDANNGLSIVNSGEVSYDIYLRANALYNFTQSEANQQKYNLYPFVNPNDENEKGGHFSATYATIEDQFNLYNSAREGWYQIENFLYYYMDNEPLTGIHKLPGYENPANYYYYSFAEDGTCNGLVSGLFELNGKLYYALFGELQSGWHTVTKNGETKYYFFNTASYAAIDGEWNIGGYHYTFVDCVLVRGDLVTNSTGTRYMWAGSWATDTWLNIDGEIAYASMSGYFYTGLKKCPSPEGDYRYYIFGDDGFWVQDADGLYDYKGKTYLADDGYIVEYPGLVKIGDYYYYFNGTNAMVKNCSYWVSKPNGIMGECRCTFDAEGRLIDPLPGTGEDPETPKPELKNGFMEENGTTYYYVNGVKTYAGLIVGDGTVGEEGAYYYVNSEYKVIKNRTYWVSKTNGLMKEGWHDFDADGKMVVVDDPIPDVPDNGGDQGEIKNGFVDENGTTYYYVNGVKTYAGVIIGDGTVGEEGAYYYVNSEYKVIKNRTYWISKTNGMLVEKRYTFDADGKIVFDIDTEKPGTPDSGEGEGVVKNGFVEENGATYYYVNGVKTYAGLIEIDGNYYYVNSEYKVIKSRTYWISKTNGLMKEGWQEFDADGKMVIVVEEEPEIKDGFVDEDGVTYYYVNDVKTYAGLIEIDGNYYYVNSEYKVIKNRTYWISKTNGIVKEGWYVIDANGIVDLG